MGHSSSNTAEKTWREIIDTYTQVAQEVLGVRKKQKRAPWISQEVLELSDQRRQIKAVKAHSEENRKMHYKITRQIKEKAKQSREQWLEERCLEVENCGRNQNPRKRFQTVNEICGTYSPRLPTAKDKDGYYNLF